MISMMMIPNAHKILTVIPVSPLSGMAVSVSTNSFVRMRCELGEEKINDKRRFWTPWQEILYSLTVGCKREVMAGGAFSLVSFLPDVAESVGEAWQTG